MSSTLFIRKTPKPTKNEIAFKQPIKGIIAGRYYDHDGSLGGGKITVGPEDLPWFEGVLAARPRSADAKDWRDFERVVEMLRDGESIDMWFEV